jgi:hypothetical protein
MNLATNGQWTGSYSGAVIDGVSIWESIINDKNTGRSELAFYSYQDAYAGIYDNIKMLYNLSSNPVETPDVYFDYGWTMGFDFDFRSQL